MFAKKLTKGDTIGILSLAGCVKDEFPYEKIEEFFDRYDYRVKFSAHVTDKKRYLAGDDDTRVRELEAFLRMNQSVRYYLQGADMERFVCLIRLIMV